MGRFNDIKKKKTEVDKFIDGAEKYHDKSSGNEQESQERLNVEIPKALHKAIKMKALKDDTKMKDIVIKALNDHLKL